MSQLLTTAARSCAAVMVVFGLSTGAMMLTAKTAAAGVDEGTLGYPFGTSLAKFKSMPLPFSDLPKDATVKCSDDADLEGRMVGYVARDEQRYEAVGIKTCRVVQPDPANSAWWRPVEFTINGVKARLRFDFMEVADAPETNGGSDEAEVTEVSMDETGFSDALYGGNALVAPGGKQYALVAARVMPVHGKDGYKLMAGVNQRLGDASFTKDLVEIAPGISFKMEVPTWQRGNMTVAAWDPSELGHYDLVFTMTSAKKRLQSRLGNIQ